MSLDINSTLEQSDTAKIGRVLICLTFHHIDPIWDPKTRLKFFLIWQISILGSLDRLNLQSTIR